MQLISLVGAAGSGKNAVADVLIAEYGFKSLAFAGCLKDAVSVIFGWERRLLEGDTVESRQWREQVDPWWANELSMPNLTPRSVLQQFGTELIRNQFHSDIWLLTVKRKITSLGPDAKIVVTDARFPNEIDMTSSVGGKNVRVKRGPNPDWWSVALDISRSAKPDGGLIAFLNTQAHASEWAWARDHYSHVVENDGSLDDLRHKTKAMMKALF